MSRGGRIDRILDRIPGYGGYRDKERRRESDRVIREQLALEYGQLAERLGRLAQTLADERKIQAIGQVDKPHKRLVSFIDRVRTASYGYSPLFSDTPIEEEALDQIAAFDRNLADQQETLASQIDALESADPGSDAFKSAAGDIVDTVEKLHDRFDKRREVIEQGKALPQSDVLAILEPVAAEGGSPVAFRLHEGEAVARQGVNYSVTGRVSAATGATSWRAFQLRGGSNNEWLQVSDNPALPMYWLQRVEITGQPGSPSVTALGETYNLVDTASGSGEVIGAQGSASAQPVQFMRYETGSGKTMYVYSWSSGALALTGRRVEPGEVDVFSRER